MANYADDLPHTGRGANAAFLRNHNERAVLTLLRTENMSSKALAGALGVSAQTTSVITRELETAQLITKTRPQKGSVGKPQVPWTLNPSGAFGAGLRIGRRSADFVLMDFVGGIFYRNTIHYPNPTPDLIKNIFIRELDTTQEKLGDMASRLTGIGIAAPFDLGSWDRSLASWKTFDMQATLARYTHCPIFIMNDATMACNGEMLYGVGRNIDNFAYVYLGTLVGGGIVLNGQVVPGAMGNAAAFASLPTDRPNEQLADHAAISILESKLATYLGENVTLTANNPVWARAPQIVDMWLDDIAPPLARAALTIKAVLDIPQIILDGSLPTEIKKRLTDKVQSIFDAQNQRGLTKTTFRAGILGESAAALGAANLPLLNAHFLEGTRIV